MAFMLQAKFQILSSFIRNLLSMREFLVFVESICTNMFPLFTLCHMGLFNSSGTFMGLRIGTKLFITKEIS